MIGTVNLLIDARLIGSKISTIDLDVDCNVVFNPLKARIDEVIPNFLLKQWHEVLTKEHIEKIRVIT